MVARFLSFWKQIHKYFMSDSRTFLFKMSCFLTFFSLEDDAHVYKANGIQFT